MNPLKLLIIKDMTPNISIIFGYTAAIVYAKKKGPIEVNI